MKVSELLNENRLSEAEAAKVDAFIDEFVSSLLEDEGGDFGDVIDGSPVSEPVTPPGGTTPAPGAPNDPGPKDPISAIAGLWFKTLVGQMWWLASASRAKKRLKQIGIGGEANKRITKSIAIAQKNIGRLFDNPGWRPAPRFKIEAGKPPKPLNKSYMVPVSKQIHGILAYEMKKIPGKIILESLQSQRAADTLKTQISAKLKPYGFQKDRDLWLDGRGNAIEVLIELEDELVRWSVGKMRGRRPAWSKEGTELLSSARLAVDAVVEFARNLKD